MGSNTSSKTKVDHPAASKKTSVKLKDVEFKFGNDTELTVKNMTVTLGLKWDFFDGMDPVDLDAAVVLFNSDGTFIDLCFYNNLTVCNGAIVHSGDVKDGKKEGWDETISIDLEQAVDACQIMVFVINAYNSGTFEQVETASVALMDSDGTEIMTADVGTGGKNTSLCHSILYYNIDDNNWHFREVGAKSLGRTVKDVMCVVRKAIAETIPKLKSIMEKKEDDGVNKLNFFKSVCALEDRDYTIIVDKSGSMSGDRWNQAKNAVTFLAPQCVKADTDGITLYFFSSSSTKSENITSAKKVMKAFSNNSPSGSTNLHDVLERAFNDRTKKKPLTILVITDGCPNNSKKVEQLIINESKRLNKDEDLSISFIQVGGDSSAASWLTKLDDDLESHGAKFDIVDTLSCNELKDIGFEQMIKNSIED